MYDQEALRAGDEIIRLFDALAKTWPLAILNDSKNVGNNLATSAVSIRIFCALSWYHKSRVVSVVSAFRDATTCTPGHGFVFFRTPTVLMVSLSPGGFDSSRVTDHLIAPLDSWYKPFRGEAKRQTCYLELFWGIDKIGQP